jgi:hypothetical protein
LIRDPNDEKKKRKGHHTVDFQSNGYGKGSVIFITGIGRINIQREREREGESIHKGLRGRNREIPLHQQPFRALRVILHTYKEREKENLSIILSKLSGISFVWRNFLVSPKKF